MPFKGGFRGIWNNFNLGFEYFLIFYFWFFVSYSSEFPEIFGILNPPLVPPLISSIFFNLALQLKGDALRSYFSTCQGAIFVQGSSPFYVVIQIFYKLFFFFFLKINYLVIIAFYFRAILSQQVFFSWQILAGLDARQEFKNETFGIKHRRWLLLLAYQIRYIKTSFYKRTCKAAAFLCSIYFIDKSCSL